MPQYINISKAIHELDAAVTPAAGDLVAIDRNDGGTWVTLKADIDDLPGGGGGGASAFTGLSDTPANYTGAAGKLVVVNSTPDGLEFITPPYVPLLALIKSVATNYELVAGDLGYLIRVTDVATITLPDGLATGFQCIIRRAGAGAVTLAAATTMNSAGTTIPAQHDAVSVVHIGSNVWDVYGVLE
jgi:hypothetical protein